MLQQWQVVYVTLLYRVLLLVNPSHRE
uniref:Uncharacterized protein n=1 Tax=Rhizophora mucronata TaxID=61149 RepID=A0A2P2PYL8_RHIMU